MSAGARKKKRSQDKVPLAPSEVKANNVCDDEAFQSSSSSSSDDGKSEGPVTEAKKKKEEHVRNKDDASSVTSASSSSSMSAGARKQKKSQDKVPLSPSEVKAKDVGDYEASQSLSSSSDD